MPNSNIDTTNGGGPWSIAIPALDAGESKEYHLNRMEFRGRKGYFRKWTPLDNAAFQNRDPDNGVEVVYNGQFDAFVGPNSADTYSEAGITRIKVTNVGSTVIEEENLKLQVSKDAYDADDAARQQANRHPVEKLARGVLGL